MTDHLRARANEILRRLEGMHRPRMVEIGVMRGLLSRLLLTQRRDLELVMIDSWLPTDQQPEAYRATRDVSALCRDHSDNERQARAIAASVAPRARVIKADSVAAAAEFAPGAFDLVFIDADHSEPGVRRDIAAWRDRVRPGGWLGGHDYANPYIGADFSGVQRAVDDLCPGAEIGGNYTWWIKPQS